VFGFALSAYALTVQCTLTSPTITKVEDGCEKLGSVQFDFPEGSVLTEGEHWYIDLPIGVELCKPLDYFIAQAVTLSGAAYSTMPATPEETAYIIAESAGNETYAHFEAGTALAGPALDGTYGACAGPLFGTKIDTAGTGNGFTAAGDVALRVVGKEGGRRIYIYVG
jgi:hypothetical protein